MQDKINLIDYEEKYAKEIDDIEKGQWGIWESENEDSIINRIKDVDFIKLAKSNEKIVGVCEGRKIGDAFLIDAIVITSEFQHKSIGSSFMEEVLKYSKEFKLKNIICECVIAKGVMNAEKLMKKYNFEEIIRIEGFWGSLYKQNYICVECGFNPCKCTAAIFKKNIN